MLHLTAILLPLAAALGLHLLGAWRGARDLAARSTELRDPGLAPVLDRLAGALGLARLAVRIHEVPTVNGMAAADGRIYLTRGLHDRYRAGAISAEELASVVAHELGHVALGHSRRRMVDFAGQNAIRMALAMTLGRLVPGLGWLIANGLATLLAARLSREDEFEADAYAAALMTKAGLGTTPQVRLLEKLSHGAGVGGGPAAWLASHPGTEDRVAAIKALAVGWTDARR